MKTKFTPAPWYRNGREIFSDRPGSRTNGDKFVGQSYSSFARYGEEYNEENMANANLMSVAPEMFNLLLSIKKLNQLDSETQLQIDLLLKKAIVG